MRAKEIKTLLTIRIPIDNKYKDKNNYLFNLENIKNTLSQINNIPLILKNNNLKYNIGICKNAKCIIADKKYIEFECEILLNGGTEEICNYNNGEYTISDIIAIGFDLQ